MKKPTQSKSTTKSQTKHRKPGSGSGGKKLSQNGALLIGEEITRGDTDTSRPITITLSEPAYLLAKVLAEHDGYKSLEEWALSNLADGVGEFVADIKNEEVQPIFGILSRGDKKHNTHLANAVSRAMTKPTTREIVLKLSEKAWRILDGYVASEGWDSAEHMILSQTSSFIAQSTDGGDEKEYARIFGLKVDKKGRTHLL